MGKLKQQLPALVYESLPYVYGVIGITILAISQTPWLIMSSLGWLFASGTVLWMRIAYRKALKEELVSQGKRASRILRNDAGVTQLFWNKKLECGNSRIDAQHQKIFQSSNDLLRATHTQRGRSDVLVLFDVFIGDIKVNFAFEEMLLLAFMHRVADEQERVHAELLKQALGRVFT